VTVVAAAGNYGEAKYGNPLGCPASYPGVISVAATNANGTRASFSQYNSYVDLAAPGVGSMFVDEEGYWDSGDGTSFASPLVSAAAALLKRTNTNLTPAQIENILKYTAQDAITYGYDVQTGWGILDAAEAMAFARNPAAAKPITERYVPHAQQVVLSPDLTGDGRGDLLVRDSTDAVLNGRTGAASGKLFLYPMTANATLGTPIVLGTGWANMTVYAPGDWNGDGKNDILARDSTGRLYLYRGNGAGGFTGSWTEVGHGWSPFTVIPAGDLNGDKKNDLLAVRNDTGDLYLYRGSGGGGFQPGYRQVGHGWNSMAGLYAAGDLNGDGKNDILGITLTGDLLRYYGYGSGTFQGSVNVGHGWQNMASFASGASLDADRYSDLVGLTLDWKMYFYKGRGGGSFAAKALLGSGF
ncbi:MAG: FG-GAP-like repeat-containing protein, partial [Bifidobacteriaceae bacterium]|jgi:hypothetical protein|nr:FG-GAP-like repeat-containing protein [Bifidobacteriaceae bacterium]